MDRTIPRPFRKIAEGVNGVGGTVPDCAATTQRAATCAAGQRPRRPCGWRAGVSASGAGRARVQEVSGVKLAACGCQFSARKRGGHHMGRAVRFTLVMIGVAGMAAVSSAAGEPELV